MVHAAMCKQGVEALAHLPNRRLSAYFHACLCSGALKAGLVSLARALCCMTIEATEPESERDGKHAQHDWRFSMAPLAVHLVLRLVSPSAMLRVRRVVAEWGLDKQTRGLAAIGLTLTGGPCGSDWRGITRDAASHFRAIPSTAIRPSHLGSGPLSAPDARLLEGARLAPSLVGVDAYISYTVSLGFYKIFFHF